MSEVAALQRELESIGRRVARDLGKLIHNVAEHGDTRGLQLVGREIEEIARHALLYRSIESRYVRAIERLEQAR